MNTPAGGRPPLRVVEAARIRQAVDRGASLQAVEAAFAALARGATLPSPLSIEVPEARGEVHAKGAWLPGAAIFAIKVATGFYRNPERGLPTGSGLVLVFDAHTGFPLALLQDDGWLTEMRTAAAGALAAKLLGPPSLERMAMIGTGSQARFQLRAIADVLPPGRVQAWSPRADAVERYCREMQEELGLDVRPAATPEAAVADAALVVTVTPSRAPLVPSSAIRDGATVVAVGSDGPGKQELDPALLARADKLVVDHLEQCARLGELQHALGAGLLERADVHATLGEVVLGRRSGREGSELIVCDLTGVGVQDAAIAEAAWNALA